MPPARSRKPRKAPAVPTVKIRNEHKMDMVYVADGESHFDQVMEKIGLERERIGKARKARRKKLPLPNMTLFEGCGPNLLALIKEAVYDVPEEPTPITEPVVYPSILPKKKKAPLVKRKRRLVIHDHFNLPSNPTPAPYEELQLFESISSENHEDFQSDPLNADYCRWNNLRFGSDDGRKDDTLRITTKGELVKLEKRMKIARLEAERKSAEKRRIEEQKEAKRREMEAKKAEKLRQKEEKMRQKEEKLAQKKGRKRPAEQILTPASNIKKGRTTRTSRAAMAALNNEIPVLEPVKDVLSLEKGVSAVNLLGTDDEMEEMPSLLDMNDEEVPSSGTIVLGSSPAVSKDTTPVPECSVPSTNDPEAVVEKGRDVMATELHLSHQAISLQHLEMFNDDLMAELCRLRTTLFQDPVSQKPCISLQTASTSTECSKVQPKKEVAKEAPPPTQSVAVKKEAVELAPPQRGPRLSDPSLAIDSILTDSSDLSSSVGRTRARMSSREPSSDEKSSDLPSSSSSAFSSNPSSSSESNQDDEAGSDLSGDDSELSSFARDCGAPSADEVRISLLCS